MQGPFLNDNIRYILYADDLQVYTQVPCDELESGARQLSAAAGAVLGRAVAHSGSKSMKMETIRA